MHVATDIKQLLIEQNGKCYQCKKILEKKKFLV